VRAFHDFLVAMIFERMKAKSANHPMRK